MEEFKWLYDEDGDPARRPFLRQLLVPSRVALDDLGTEPLLRYWWYVDDKGPEWRWPVPEFLIAFVNLAGKPPEAYLRFAQRWGVLNICEHGWPFVHDDACWRAAVLQSMYAEQRPEGFTQAVAVWTRYVEGARAILEVARFAHERHGRGEITDEGLLHRAYAAFLEEPFKITTGAFASDFAAMCVNMWLEKTQTRPRLEWPTQEPIALDPSQPPGPRIELAGIGLLGALAVLLLFGVSAAKGVELCSSCGAVYIRKQRAAQRGRRNFCPDCGHKAAVNLATQRWRAAHKEAKDGNQTR